MHSPNKTDQSLLSIGTGLDFTLRYLKREHPVTHRQTTGRKAVSIDLKGSA